MQRSVIEDLATRHKISAEAVEVLAQAVSAGGGKMAQFSHPDLGGMGQWSRGGMIMLGDVSNHDLKARVAALSTDIAEALENNPDTDKSDHPRESDCGSGGEQPWWPSEFGCPSSSGAQNNARYAFFPEARRLVIEDGGKRKIYDTADHAISGVSQQQSGSHSLRFSSQNGVISLEDLTEV